MFDLVVRGHVLDPGSGLDGQHDVAVTGGIVTAIEPAIPARAARRVLDATTDNRYVVPGLVNAHTHVTRDKAHSHGVQWGDPDRSGIAAGVTTVVDAGSAGAGDFAVVAAGIPGATTRIVSFLNVGTRAHATAAPDVSRLDDIDRAAIAGTVARHPGLVRGFKLRLVGPLVERDGEQVIARAKAVAGEYGLPLMVHLGDPTAGYRRGQELTRLLLRTLGAGDIVTHVCTPHPGGVLTPDGVPVPELAASREAGVLWDASTGLGHFSFDVARRQFDLGLHPDTISTDRTMSGDEVVLSLVEVMSKYMAVGYTFAEVVRMTTVNGARLAGLAGEAGSIAVGRPADLTVLDVVTGRWRFVDRIQSVTGQQAIAPIWTMRAGTVHEPAAGRFGGGMAAPTGARSAEIRCCRESRAY